MQVSPIDAIAYLDAVAPRMRELGVKEFIFGSETIVLGEDPTSKVAAPSPPPRTRQSAVDLAISGPPVTPQYADANPAGK